VYRLDENTALVQTVDFFTPIVDDPRIFGRAAAANSLSDVYAMGGCPITAMNVVCFPVKTLGIAPLRSILEGGLEILKEAGVALIGGHSVEDDEPKYGLAVTGLVDPNRIMKNSGLRPGDRLILTKPVGTGVIATAVKGGLASEVAVSGMVRSMCTLNRAASEVAVGMGVVACTDVTGFGLAGHVVEMARAGNCRIRIDSGKVPLLEGALDAASMGMVPAGTYGNRNHFMRWITLDETIPAERSDLLFDPQTSGGLVLGVPQDRVESVKEALRSAKVEWVAEIGEVLATDPAGRLEIV
jgi:selenide, water dikinase